MMLGPEALLLLLLPPVPRDEFFVESLDTRPVPRAAGSICAVDPLIDNSAKATIAVKAIRREEEDPFFLCCWRMMSFASSPVVLCVLCTASLDVTVNLEFGILMIALLGNRI